MQPLELNEAYRCLASFFEVGSGRANNLSFTLGGFLSMHQSTEPLKMLLTWHTSESSWDFSPTLWSACVEEAPNALVTSCSAGPISTMSSISSQVRSIGTILCQEREH